MTTVVAAVISQNGRMLICQRRRDKAFPLEWEFPGGKVEPNESLEEALARELFEELGVRAKIGGEVHRVRYQYPERPEPLEIVFFSAAIPAGPSDLLNKNNEFEQLLWVAPADLPTYDFLGANAELISRLAKGTHSTTTSAER